MRVLVTGFEPFGGEKANASLEAVRRLRARIGALEIATTALPTSYGRSLPALEAAIARVRPQIVLCVGQAGDRSALCVERVAVNIQDARTPDNDGAQPVDTPVVAGGPAAYLATLPVRAAVAALRADARLAVVTRSEKGCIVVSRESTQAVHAVPVERVVDTTGAGDLFAAGFLFGLARELATEDAARLGALAAAEVIQHLGARPETSLKALAEDNGLLG